MKRFGRVLAPPPQRRSWHFFLTALLQVVALAALAIVMRDQRPDPATDRLAWERMGMLAEFVAMAPAAALFTFVAVAGMFAILCEPAAQRERWSVRMLVCLAAGVALTDAGALYYGWQTEIWDMFGSVAAIASADLVLSYLVLRCLDVPPAHRRSVSVEP